MVEWVKVDYMICFTKKLNKLLDMPSQLCPCINYFLYRNFGNTEKISEEENKGEDSGERIEFYRR